MIAITFISWIFLYSSLEHDTSSLPLIHHSLIQIQKNYIMLLRIYAKEKRIYPEGIIEFLNPQEIIDTTKPFYYFENFITQPFLKKYKAIKFCIGTVCKPFPPYRWEGVNQTKGLRNFYRVYAIVIVDENLNSCILTPDNVRKVLNRLIKKEKIILDSPEDALNIVRFYVRLFIEQGPRGDEWFFGDDFLSYEKFKKRFDYYYKSQERFQNHCRPAITDVVRLIERDVFHEGLKKLKGKVLFSVKEKFDGYEVELLTYNVWTQKIKKWKVRVKRDGEIE